MNRKLTAEECFAKAEAYEECAEHLAMDWTDDSMERRAGQQVEKILRIRAKKWWKLGRKRGLRGKAWKG